MSQYSESSWAEFPKPRKRLHVSIEYCRRDDGAVGGSVVPNANEVDVLVDQLTGAVSA